MPRKEIDYSKTIIYKIVCKDPTITHCYVGHTTDFTNRKNKHKYNCNKPECKHYNIFVYKTIRENGGWSNFEMLEIEKYNCKDSTEASLRERFWLETLNADLNKQVPSRSQKEYKIVNKEIIIEYHKNYHINNKDKLIERSKQYYENNKEKILKHNLTKIECECGCNLRKSDLPRHKRTKKHINLMQEKQNQQELTI